MFTKIAPQFTKSAIQMDTPGSKIAHGLKILFQALD
jgi:hypothetical protein